MTPPTLTQRIADRCRAVWWRLPSWLRATITSAAQVFAGAVGLTVIGAIEDLAEQRPVDWLDVLDDVRTQSIMFAHAVAVAVWRRARPAERAYPS